MNFSVESLLSSSRVEEETGRDERTAYQGLKRVVASEADFGHRKERRRMGILDRPWLCPEVSNGCDNRYQEWRRCVPSCGLREDKKGEKGGGGKTKTLTAEEYHWPV
jgi:hypothetical protein